MGIRERERPVGTPQILLQLRDLVVNMLNLLDFASSFCNSI